jgi:hypothetical protein
MMYKMFYKHILSNLLVGKRFEDYKDKKIFNKFTLYDINFDYNQKEYNLDNNKNNICIVIVKNGIIVKVLDVKN